jgi:hypothetical protein
MSEAGGAVFLSYASQDADAARRICEALRAGGVVVWLDQSELRGGDAWDQRIRQQIRECALFVPIVSANTQSRLEGYFRREWRLGVDRTLDMADGKAFLVPVAIDDTPDRNAHVPDAFRAVQWTRLPDGETSDVFVDRVKRLVSADAVAPAAPVAHNARRPARSSRRLVTYAVWIGAIVIALGYFAFGWWRGAHEEEAAPPPPPVTPAAAADELTGPRQ